MIIVSKKDQNNTLADPADDSEYEATEADINEKLPMQEQMEKVIIYDKQFAVKFKFGLKADRKR